MLTRDHATNTVLGAAVRVTAWGALINLVLAAAKLIVGGLGGSIALVADGVHSLSDLLTDGVTILGTYVRSKPPDESHPYGHGKFEAFAVIVVAMALLAAGGAIAAEAIASLVRGDVSNAGPLTLVVASASVVSKEAMFRWTRNVGRSIHSPVVMANAWHHRSDALSSVAVLVGAALAMFGWYYGDQAAGVLVGLMVVAVGGRIAFDALGELSERSAGRRDVETICKCLKEHPGVRSFHRLRTRRAGPEVFIDTHVLVDPKLTVLEAHTIADEIEASVEASLAKPTNILVHIEPDIEELRKP